MSLQNNQYLALRLGVLGDVILTTGVLYYWHQTQGANFHLLTKAPWAPLFKHHPAITKIIAIKDSDLKGRGWWSFCRNLARNYGHLPLVDLHKNLRSQILGLLWPGPKFSYAKYSLERRLFLATHHDFFSKRLKKNNVPQRYSLALEAQAPEPSLVRPQIFLTPAEKQAAAQQLQTLNLKKPIAIHPYATHPAKTPQPSTWQQVVHLLQDQGQEVLILGQHAQPLLPQASYDLTNSTSLRQTAALLSHCRYLISGDSGPMHLATAVGTPVLALFGPTTQEWGFYPSGPEDIIDQAPCSQAPCSLHGQNKCGAHPLCMAHFTAKYIFDLTKLISS